MATDPAPARFCIVSIACHRATGFAERARGLIGHAELQPAAGMLFPGVRAVHGCWMSRPIDVVFLSAEHVVLAVTELRPWRAAWNRSAAHTLELRAGSCATLQIRPGMRIDFVRVNEMKQIFVNETDGSGMDGRVMSASDWIEAGVNARLCDGVVPVDSACRATTKGSLPHVDTSATPNTRQAMTSMVTFGLIAIMATGGALLRPATVEAQVLAPLPPLAAPNAPIHVARTATSAPGDASSQRAGRDPVVVEQQRYEPRRTEARSDEPRSVESAQAGTRPSAASAGVGTPDQSVRPAPAGAASSVASIGSAPLTRPTLDKLAEEAEALYRSQQDEASLERYMQLAQSDPSRQALSWLRIGNLHHRQGRIGAAVDAYLHAQDVSAPAGTDRTAARPRGLSRSSAVDAALAASELDARRKALHNLNALTTQQAMETARRLAELAQTGADHLPADGRQPDQPPRRPAASVKRSSSVASTAAINIGQ